MSERPKVLVVDDDAAVCSMLRNMLDLCGCTCLTAGSGETALEIHRGERPAAVLLDIGLPGMDGLSTLAALKQADRDVPVIVISGLGQTTTVVQAMRLGAADFICKPLDERSLQGPLEHALRQRQLSLELSSLRSQVESEPRHRLLVGASPRMAEVCRVVETVADTDAPVLVRGESGTGKDLVARALHRRSSRRERPFVKVNCAALPTDLLESELFGYERGAFTGAVQQKPGRFEFANRGTMFLDEIAEMRPALQAKLLQVLQDGEFSRLGGKTDVRVDARVVAATNRDLEQVVAAGQFREDLFFRLNVVSIWLPPLRERRQDIPMFAEYFLRKYSVQYNKPLPVVAAATWRLLAEHDWPGNVRELENTIRRLVILGTDGPIHRELERTSALAVPRRAPAPPPAEAPAAAPDEPPAPASLKDIARAAARDAERVAIARMLQRTRWNRKEAAEILGISYKALLYKIKETGLDKPTTTT
jgi:two-component system, NtrC family, response regulator AtoC